MPRFNSDSRTQNDSLENEMKTLLSKVRDVKGRIQCEDRERRLRSPGRHAHSIEQDSNDQDTIEPDIEVDKNGSEEFAS